MSQPTFLNRQALYLRPDPARVIVRPFKPATEPRDFNLDQMSFQIDWASGPSISSPDPGGPAISIVERLRVNAVVRRLAPNTPPKPLGDLLRVEAGVWRR